MLLLDRREERADKGDLAGPLSATGASFEKVELACGDIIAVSPAGRTFAFERKRVGDLLRVIADGRFVAEQLPCLLDTYERVYLLVEGRYKRGEDGHLLIPRGRDWMPVTWGRRGGWTYAEVEHWLSSREEEGLHVVHTGSPTETAHYLKEKDTWLGKEKHRSGGAVYIAPIRSVTPPTLTRKIASLLPGVGQERSAAVADAFSSVVEMVGTASAIADSDRPENAKAMLSRWTAIPGIGKTTAMKISESVRSK